MFSVLQQTLADSGGLLLGEDGTGVVTEILPGQLPAVNGLGCTEAQFVHPNTLITGLLHQGDHFHPVDVTLAGQPVPLVDHVIVGHMGGDDLVAQQLNVSAVVLTQGVVEIEANPELVVGADDLLQFRSPVAQAGSGRFSTARTAPFSAA